MIQGTYKGLEYKDLKRSFPDFQKKEIKIPKLHGVHTSLRVGSAWFRLVRSAKFYPTETTAFVLA